LSSGAGAAASAIVLLYVKSFMPFEEDFSPALSFPQAFLRWVEKKAAQ
jgi:hypothetical protein